MQTGKVNLHIHDSHVTLQAICHNTVPIYTCNDISYTLINKGGHKLILSHYFPLHLKLNLFLPCKTLDSISCLKE